MSDEDIIDDINSQPFFVGTQFPFLFIPAQATGFTFNKTDAHTFNSDDQTTTEFLDSKEQNQAEKETVDDEIDQTEKSDNGTEEKNNLRISQPEYSKLLRDLDFSQSRMVDVTNLLSDGVVNCEALYENNQKSTSNRSSISTAETDDQQISSTITVTNEKEEIDNLENAVNDIENDLNNLASIILETSQISVEKQENKREKEEYITSDTHKAHGEDDDDTSKQVTNNYDLNDTENKNKEPSNKSAKSDRLINQTSNGAQDDNLSSIPRFAPTINNRAETRDEKITWNNLVHGTDSSKGIPNILIFSRPINENQTTPIKEQQTQLTSEDKLIEDATTSSSKENLQYRLRQLSSTSSNTSSPSEPSKEQPKQTIDNDLNNRIENVLEQDRVFSTKVANDILYRRLSNQQNGLTSPCQSTYDHSPSSQHNENIYNIQNATHDTWLNIFEKLEREHKERLEKQQKQYEEYMSSLEEKMKRRFDDYVSTTNSIRDSKSDALSDSMNSHASQNTVPTETNGTRHRTHSQSNVYRPLAKEINNHYYTSNSTAYNPLSDKQRPMGGNLSRSQSREDISNLRSELSAKHAKHISDLKLYYEQELDELRNQLNASKMGHSSSATRQSIETIERINNDNIRLHDDIKQIRHSLKTQADENHGLKRQIDDLREQVNRKDAEIKDLHRTISELEHNLSEANNAKERQNEKLRYADRQAIIYREDIEKLTSDLSTTKERLLRIEERCRELEIENKTYRQPILTNDHNNNQSNNQYNTFHDHKLHSTMPLNVPTSREYGRFTMVSSKCSASSTITTKRDDYFDAERYTTKLSDELLRPDNPCQSFAKMNDYTSEKSPYLSNTNQTIKPVYSPRKISPNRHRIDQMPVKDSIDNRIKQSQKLEEQFDELLRRKRDLESRLNRIPSRGLTSSDRQLYDVLEREIERVEQSLSSVKLELRKMNILRTY